MPANAKKVPEFYFNSKNVRIKKCCASCEFKVCCNDNDHRICRLSGKKVTKDFLCQSWRISKCMDLIGLGR